VEETRRSCHREVDPAESETDGAERHLNISHPDRGLRVLEDPLKVHS
jgi:hypothetical protein